MERKTTPDCSTTSPASKLSQSPLVVMPYPSARQRAQPIIVPTVHYLDWLATALLRHRGAGGVVVPPAAGNGGAESAYPSYCSTCIPAFQSLTYISPSGV